MFFESKDDPDYQSILAHIRAAGQRLDTIKRFDMPGFIPRYPGLFTSQVGKSRKVSRCRSYGYLAQNTGQLAVWALAPVFTMIQKNRG